MIVSVKLSLTSTDIAYLLSYSMLLQRRLYVSYFIATVDNGCYCVLYVIPGERSNGELEGIFHGLPYYNITRVLTLGQWFSYNDARWVLRGNHGVRMYWKMNGTCFI